MSIFDNYINELKTMTVFQNIPADELLALLDVMNPEIVIKEAGSSGGPGTAADGKGPDIEAGVFCIVLRGKPLDRLEERLDIYNMPKFGEPGMMMGEVPVLSEMPKCRSPKEGGSPMPMGPNVRNMKKPGGIPFEMHLMKMTPEMITAFYGEEHAHAQGIMLRNFLGIMAQKVTDVRKEKYRLDQEYKKVLADTK